MRVRLAFICLTLALPTPSPADPGWWETRGVMNPGAPAANLAPATIGQAKHMASMALAELNDKLPAARFQALQTDLAQIVDLSIPDPVPTDFYEKQKAPLLIGQLKAMAKPFYDQLRLHDAAWLDNAMANAQLVVMEPGISTPSPYPWTEATTDDNNRAPANLGQLKAAFSLQLETLPSGPVSPLDTDGDGMPDTWEIQFGLNPNDPSDAALDSDGDGLSNLEEFQMGTNPTNADSDGDGISDWDEINLYGTDPTVSDSDGDGITDGGEIDGGTKPNDPGETPAAEWVKLTGDLEVDQRKQKTRTITIPKGQTRLVLVVLHSDEYPYYTESGSAFNDLLDWKIESTGSNPITGQVDVNARHVDWMAAEYETTEIEGYSPVHMEQTQTLTAPPDQDLAVEIELGATNIGDGSLPSTVMVGLLPVEVTIAFGQGPEVPPNAGNQTSRELLEAYLDGIKVAHQGDIWAVNGKDAQGNDKIWVVEIGSDQEKLKSALGSSGRYVVFDGHSNFGFGPDFGGIPVRSIDDFTNFGSKYTDVPLDFRYRGDNPNPERDPANWGQQGFPFLVVNDVQLPAAPTNYKPLPINEKRFPNVDGIDAGQVFQKQGQGFDTWHYHFEANSKRLMIDAPKTDLPANLAFKTFFYNACSSGIDYIENFKHGDFVYTKKSCFVHQGTKIFVQGVVEGKTTAQIMPLLNQLGVGSSENGDITNESILEGTSYAA